MRRNDLGDREDVYVPADVFEVLRAYGNNKWKFDIVILDPPKFAHSKRHVEKATRGYKDINMLGMKLVKPGGILMTFSCSGTVSPDLFQKVLFGASVDAGRTVQIIERLSQASDHPILLTYPESEYLKGVICRVW
jgi:23S rRNA (cytosine1962-C5)-methyltransferase